VQINGDWETVLVSNLGTSGTYSEYVMVLENSFSEPLLKVRRCTLKPVLKAPDSSASNYKYDKPTFQVLLSVAACAPCVNLIRVSICGRT